MVWRFLSMRWIHSWSMEKVLGSIPSFSIFWGGSRRDSSPLLASFPSFPTPCCYFIQPSVYYWAADQRYYFIVHVLNLIMQGLDAKHVLHGKMQFIHQRAQNGFRLLDWLFVSTSLFGRICLWYCSGQCRMYLVAMILARRIISCLSHSSMPSHS